MLQLPNAVWLALEFPVHRMEIKYENNHQLNMQLLRGQPGRSKINDTVPICVDSSHVASFTTWDIRQCGLRSAQAMPLAA